MAFNFTDDNAKEIIESGKPVVIDFWAEWCGPCKRVAPIVDELAEKYKDQITVGKYNVDDYSDLSSEFGIRNIPTILLFKDGEMKERIVGSVSKEDLEDKIKTLL